MPRLTDLLARNLGISKTAAARLIEQGLVCDPLGVAYSDRKAVIPHPSPSGASVGGAPAVVVDGESLTLWSEALVLLHKPVGVITALRDPVHPLAYDLLRSAPLFPELRAAGRLDLDTSGLLLWTTDGALIQRLTHPKRRVPRTYQAALARAFNPLPADLVLDDGHRPEVLDLQPLARADAHPGLNIPASGVATLATVTIVGGAYHEVRRLFAALGSHVLALCRTQFGPYVLPPELPPGAWQHVLPAPAEGPPTKP